jgi:dTDP-4-dehydrorhamnose reductase
MKENSKKKILIIGANSFIGNHFLRNSRFATYGTAKQKNNSLIKFNIFKNSIAGIINKIMPDYALICIKKKSHSNKKKFFLKFKYLLKELNNNKIFPIFLSSDCVYDFKVKKFSYRETDARKSKNEYANEKIKIENYIFKYFNNFLILRVGKVIGLDVNFRSLIGEWQKKINQKKKIYVATDQIINPIWINDLTLVIDCLIKKNKIGIFNVSNGETITRFQIFNSFLRKQKKKITYTANTIAKISKDKNKPLELRLNNNKIMKTINFKFKKVKDILIY